MNSSSTPVADVPPAVVTVTSNVFPNELVMVGEVALIVVSLSTVKAVAATPPKSTAVAPVKFCPVIVTEVPPGVVADAVLDVAGDPEDGLTLVTTGVGGVAPAGDVARRPMGAAMRTRATRALNLVRIVTSPFRRTVWDRPATPRKHTYFAAAQSANTRVLRHYLRRLHSRRLPLENRASGRPHCTMSIGIK